MMIDRTNLFDAGYEAGFPHEFISYWLEVYIDMLNENNIEPSRTSFVNLLERKYADK